MPRLRSAWLVLAAFALQIWITRDLSANLTFTELVITASSLLLLLFIWQNRRTPGFMIIGAGLLLNLFVSVLNGGLMPVSPEMIHRLKPAIPLDTLQEGSHFAWSKDIILSTAATRLPFLSDIFLSPAWLVRREAFSVGDVLVAIGIPWSFWKLAGQIK